MKVLRIFVLSLALTALMPYQDMAQNRKRLECYDENCVFEILKKLRSTDAEVVAEAEKTIAEVVDSYRYTGDSRMGDALKNSVLPFANKFSDCKSSPYLISLIPAFYTKNDIEDIAQLFYNERLADCAIRAVGDIQGSNEYVEKYINLNKSDLQHKGAWAYAVGQQKITNLENELISWLKSADDNTKIDIYNALLIIKSNDKTLKIIEKGAKKLYKSKIANNKIAGMQLLVAVKGEKAMPMLYKVVNSENRDVHREALKLMIPYVNQGVVDKVVKKCKSEKVKPDVVDWLGEIKNDTHMDMIINQLSSKDTEAVYLAIRAIFRIDNAEGINAVKPLFGGEYQAFIEESMLAYEGDYRTLMNTLLMKGTDSQKLAALQILEKRPDVILYSRVKESINSDNQAIRDQAYKVLKLVVVPEQADYLKTLLVTCDDKNVEDVQNAIKNAMNKVSDEVKDNFASTLKDVRSDLMPRFYKVFAWFGTELCVEKLIDAYQNGAYKFDAKEALLLVENKAYKERIAEVLKN